MFLTPSGPTRTGLVFTGPRSFPAAHRTGRLCRLRALWLPPHVRGTTSTQELGYKCRGPGSRLGLVWGTISRKVLGIACLMLPCFAFCMLGLGGPPTPALSLEEGPELPPLSSGLDHVTTSSHLILVLEGPLEPQTVSAMRETLSSLGTCP